MSGLWCDPFDQYPDTTHMLDGVYANVGAGLVLSTANPCTGTQSLRISATAQELSGGINSAASWRRVFGAAKTVAGCAYHLYVPALPNSESVTDTGSTANNALRLFTFLTGGGLPQVSIVLGTDGAIVCYGATQLDADVHAAPILLGRSAAAVTAKSYNHIEARATPLASGGTVEVRVNGVTVLNVVGDTDPQSTGEVSQVLAGYIIAQDDDAVCGGPVDFDDLHAWDGNLGEGPNDFAGNAAVIYRAPNQDTATAQWTPSSGPPVYPLLCDNNDSTYISAAATDLKSAFKYTTLPADVAGVIYQQLNWRGLKTDSGDCNVTPFFVSSSDETDGAAQPMTTVETWRWSIEAYDPATSGAPWTVTAANNCEAGVLRSL